MVLYIVEFVSDKNFFDRFDRRTVNVNFYKNFASRDIKDIPTNKLFVCAQNLVLYIFYNFFDSTSFKILKIFKSFYNLVFWLLWLSSNINWQKKKKLKIFTRISFKKAVFKTFCRKKIQKRGRIQS